MLKGAISFITLLCLLITSNLSYAKSITVESKRATVRSGAGNYYNVIYKAPEGTKLEIMEELDGWYKVRLPDKTTGFVSKRAIKRRAKKDRSSGYDMKHDKGVGKAASSEIMAAAKGLTDLGLFAKRYAKRHNIDAKILEQLEDVPFSPFEYKNFKKHFSKKWDKVGIKGLSETGIQEFDRDIGAAIALRLCSAGIDTNKKLRKYVSMTGTAILENTPLYDEPFIFIVLDSPDAESFAVPGGYIFITTGAIANMKNEAELAGVLSHEIIHIVQRHGMTELKRQETRIKAKKFMGSLDDEVKNLGLEEPDAGILDDLDRMADRMFEILISGRKRENEDEADRLGTLLLYNSGYMPDGMQRFLLTMKNIGGNRSENIKSHRSYKERVSIINSVIKENRLSGNGRGYFEGGFEKNAK